MITAKAREWLGTPWQHNQQCKGYGVDCIRFIEAIASEAGFPVGEIPSNYSRSASETGLLDHLNRHAIALPLNEDAIGEDEILVFKFGGVPHHLGFSTQLPDGRVGMIHASSRDRKVVEHGLDDVWLRVLCARYRLKNADKIKD